MSDNDPDKQPRSDDPDAPPRRQTPPFDGRLADQVKESAQQIWLAGMGAFAKAQAEGRQVFEALVKEGATLQKKTQSAAEERFGDVTGKVTSMAGEASARAGQQWERIEGMFEDRTARVLQRLGVPTARDLDALRARIEELSAKLDAIAGSAAVPAPRRESREEGEAAGSSAPKPDSDPAN